MLAARKVILAGVLILSACAFGFYYLQNAYNARVDSNEALGSEVSDFNSLMRGLDSQISQLRTLDSSRQNNQSSTGLAQASATSSIDYAQQAAPSIDGSIIQLYAARTQLQSSLGQSQDANLTGVFFYRSGLPYYYIVGGVFANAGLRTANASSVSFTFYSLPDGQGTVLCMISFSLGSIPAASILSVGRLQCGSGSTSVESVTFQFKWS